LNKEITCYENVCQERKVFLFHRSQAKQWLGKFIKNEVGGINMLSEIPIDLEKVGKEDRDREILRVGMIAELDAVNLYEQLAAMAEREEVKKVLLDIAKEEKTHMGEFQALLLKQDKEQLEELEKGKEEVEELVE